MPEATTPRDMLSPEKALFKWYEKVPGRTVDLIGDYAGNELFLVEGDSLLLHCLDTDDIDFRGGFQLLHAVHSVEVFLAALLQRKANFHIAFFDAHSSLCVPARAKPETRFKYELTRAAIIRHLTQNLRKTQPSIMVMQYVSYQDPAFTQFITQSGLYFLMCHDGASSKVALPSLPDTAANASAEEEETVIPPDEHAHRLAFRRMIFWFVKRGINIALTNSVEWHDTKIMAMVQERSRRLNPELQRAEEVLQDKDADYSFTSTSKSADDDLNSDLKQVVGNFKSELYCITAVALKRILTKNPTWSSEVTAFILHTVLIYHLPLGQRRAPRSAKGPKTSQFLPAVCGTITEFLGVDSCIAVLNHNFDISDIADLVDGRLFDWVLENVASLNTSTLGSQIAADVKSLTDAVSLQPSKSQTSRNLAKVASKASEIDDDLPDPDQDHRLMPFTNEVFDKHLSSIRVEVGKDNRSRRPTGDTARTFKELTHWHNTKPIAGAKKSELTGWQKKRAMRSNHIFQRELHQYAASLTSSVGKSLDPDVIFVGQQSQAQVTSSAKADVQKAENAARIADRNEKKFVSAWKDKIKDFEAMKDPKTRYVRARTYLNGLPGDRKSLIGYEVELYMLSTLLNTWVSISRNSKKQEPDAIRFAALIFDSVNRLQKVEGPKLTKPIQKSLQLTNDSLGLPFTIQADSKVERSLSFRYALEAKDASLTISSSPLEFQLAHCGPYLDRDIDSAPDDRVKFEPDAWQRKVLDLIDLKKSVFVVAPTSAGKTFISFYAMKQVLQESDDGILVYVAPTKALVNQIAAELQAQFSKRYKYPGKSVWAIHTRDYRINDPQGCQILVTVPHILQIMLLAPSNAKQGGWSQRIKRIIFDEIHCIGQAEDGVVWEQLLLLSPCPIISLSATVGNSQEFTDWLKSTQDSMGYELEPVEHMHRYSDLRKFIYQAPISFRFQPLETDDTLGLPSLDGAQGLHYFHPVAALINESRGMPNDLHLEPRDCLSLWKCMAKHASQAYPVDPELDPAKVMPAIARKKTVIEWEARLKTLLKQWMADPKSPFRHVIAELSKPLHSNETAAQNGVSAEGKDSSVVDQDDLLSTTLPLLSTLNARNALPAILFNYDRSMCENIGQRLMEQLTQQEADWKASSPVWKKKLAQFEEYKKQKEKKAKKAPPKKSKSKGEDDDEGPSKGELEREAAEIESNPFASFNPEAPVAGFHFADDKALLPSEFEDVKKRLRWRHVSDWLIEALNRGIGIHHAGMNRSYRQAVETLFRKRFLRVVVATGTLALGINMPCKTVVFSGDSVFLTALNYRQAAGRAGRRGFDLLGNVVFQNINLDKVCRLVSSRLPDLNGHFPVTTTLILRLFTLLHESKGSTFAKRSIDSLLSQPRLYLGGEAFREQVLHHLRYSIEYLRRQYLISDDGRPINFAGTVSHLYFTENSSFAFHALLKDGYFNRLCANFSTGKSELQILDELMLTMSHLFGRRNCRRADQEFVENVVKKYSSCVFLPKMPKHARQILEAHNDETLGVFQTYVKTFVEQHRERMGPDRKLPLTEMLVGGDEASTVPGIDSAPATTVRSAFAALSGHGDQFKTIGELCRTVRDGVFLESSAIPHVAVYPQEAEMPLNAYLYDFYKHGDVVTIEKANGVRRGDIWFLLNDFSMVLATIVTSFKNFMNMAEDADLEFVEVAGSGDLHEIDEDDRIAKVEEAGSQGGGVKKTMPMGPSKVAETQNVAAPTVTQQKKKKKKKVAESWDEDEEAASSSPESEWDAGDDSDEGDAASTSTRPTTVSSSTPAWEEDSGEGLRKVALAFNRLKVTFDEKFRRMWA